MSFKCFFCSFSQLIHHQQLHNVFQIKTCWCLSVFREGRSNAHIKGDYQRIGDVMLKNFQGLKVRHHSKITLMI